MDITDAISKQLWDSVTRVRKQKSIVHCFLYLPAMDSVASSLLAIGSVPSMINAIQELEQSLDILQLLEGSIYMSVQSYSQFCKESCRFAANYIGYKNNFSIVLDTYNTNQTKARCTLLCDILEETDPSVIVIWDNEDFIEVAKTIGERISTIIPKFSRSDIYSHEKKTKEFQLVLKISKKIANKKKSIIVVAFCSDQTNTFGKTFFIITNGRTVRQVTCVHFSFQRISWGIPVTSSLIAAFISNPQTHEGFKMIDVVTHAISFFSLCLSLAVQKSYRKNIIDLETGQVLVDTIDNLYLVSEGPKINLFRHVKVIDIENEKGHVWSGEIHYLEEFVELCPYEIGNEDNILFSKTFLSPNGATKG
eukprot:c20854_g1_i1.p1 GENE.c20854_g1_i1~~c20854_g1_i1.p1  ORF type:complete len:364 (+),score=146.58 c20854_g1_i1:92-1183(+)